MASSSLTYLLGAAVYNERIGILAAILIWIDPVTIICSQKVWLGTTLAFFSVLAVYLFICGLKYHNENFFLLSGIAVGLALNTKYTGILVIFAIVFYVLFYHRALFKSKKFLLSLALPFVLLLPWVFWNFP